MSNFGSFVGIIAGIISITLAIPTFLEHKNKGLSKTALFLMSAVIVIFLGAGLYFSTSTTIIPHSPTNPFVPPNATEPSTQTNTPVPTSTPTPQVVPINQTMNCTNCSGDNYSLIVKNATIEPDKNQITLLVGLQNNTSASGNMWFNYLKLQDMQTGDHPYDGVGDGIYPNGFWISSNQTPLFRFTFPFLPVAGHTYSLSVLLRDSLSLSPITIKFG